MLGMLNPRELEQLVERLEDVANTMKVAAEVADRAADKHMAAAKLSVAQKVEEGGER